MRTFVWFSCTVRVDLGSRVQRVSVPGRVGVSIGPISYGLDGVSSTKDREDLTSSSRSECV